MRVDDWGAYSSFFLSFFFQLLMVKLSTIVPNPIQSFSMVLYFGLFSFVCGQDNGNRDGSNLALLLNIACI